MYIALAAVGSLILLVLLVAATRSNEFRLERSTEMHAPPDKIYPLLEDFHQWIQWSPWEGLDPDMKRTHSGAPKGTGARYAWDGNKKAGAGSMEITDATSPHRVVINLSFTRPFAAHNTVDFTLTPAGTGTRVVWGMQGTHAFMMKVMGVFVSMDTLVGKDFEKGLANLKAVAET